MDLTETQFRLLKISRQGAVRGIGEAETATKALGSTFFENFYPFEALKPVKSSSAN
jgi:hypothetical protein